MAERSVKIRSLVIEISSDGSGGDFAKAVDVAQEITTRAIAEKRDIDTAVRAHGARVAVKVKHG